MTGGWLIRIAQEVVGVEEVSKLVSGEIEAGDYNTKWKASNVSSGIYFYRLQAGDFVLTRKMVLLK